MNIRESASLAAAPGVRPGRRTGPRVRGAGPTARRKILLVEDDASAVQIHQHALQRRGYEVIVARDGLQALRSFNRRRPDLVVLDLYLRHVPGGEVLRQLRGAGYGGTPIVVCTAVPPERARHLTQECAPDAWLHKPCSPHDLICQIESLLAARGHPLQRTPQEGLDLGQRRR